MMFLALMVLANLHTAHGVDGDVEDPPNEEKQELSIDNRWEFGATMDDAVYVGIMSSQIHEAEKRNDTEGVRILKKKMNDDLKERQKSNREAEKASIFAEGCRQLAEDFCTFAIDGFGIGILASSYQDQEFGAAWSQSQESLYAIQKASHPDAHCEAEGEFDKMRPGEIVKEYRFDLNEEHCRGTDGEYNWKEESYNRTTARDRLHDSFNATDTSFQQFMCAAYIACGAYLFIQVVDYFVKRRCKVDTRQRTPRQMALWSGLSRFFYGKGKDDVVPVPEPVREDTASLSTLYLTNLGPEGSLGPRERPEVSYRHDPSDEKRDSK